MEHGDSASLRSSHPSKLRILKPTRHAYINFVQDFRQSYKGVPQTATQMVALAAQAWRGMGERERAPYVAMAAEERLKPRPQPTRRRRVVDRLRSQLRLAKEQLVGLKSRAKQLQVRNRRKQALRQRKPIQRKSAAPKKTSRVRRGKKVPKRQVKRARHVDRRPRQARHQPSCTSVSSTCSSSC